MPKNYFIKCHQVKMLQQRGRITQYAVVSCQKYFFTADEILATRNFQQDTKYLHFSWQLELACLMLWY